MSPNPQVHLLKLNFFSISKAHCAIEMGNSFFQRKISAVPTGGVGN